MASAFETPQKTQGRARGLLLVWLLLKMKLDLDPTDKPAFTRT